MGDIKDLKFDDKNFNQHTEFGMSQLERSLRNYGAGRSILVDKDNNIIAGNGIAEAAGQMGITKTRVIETTGDELVVVKRTDIELDSKEGREMALADNATSAADLKWDEENIKSESEKWGIDTSSWGIDFEFNSSDDEVQEVVWEGKKDSDNELSYSKPVELCAKYIKLYSDKTVLDLFGGSGSTLIACEQLGRKCYMMELDPHYCDVIRKRYWIYKTGSEEGWEEGTK